MVDTKISALPAATLPLSGTEDIAVVQGGATKKAKPRDVARVEPKHPGFLAGIWYNLTNSGATTAAVTANKLYAVPFVVEQPVTVSDLGIRVTASAGTGAKLGIYSTVSGRPAALLGQLAAPVSTAGVAAVSGPLAASLPLDPGTYWLAAIFDGAPTCAAVNGAGAASGSSVALIGSATLGDVVNNAVGGIIASLTAAATYAGGLPSTFGTPSNVLGAEAPQIALKAA